MPGLVEYDLAAVCLEVLHHRLFVLVVGVHINLLAQCYAVVEGVAEHNVVVGPEYARAVPRVRLHALLTLRAVVVAVPVDVFAPRRVVAVQFAEAAEII